MNISETSRKKTSKSRLYYAQITVTYDFVVAASSESKALIIASQSVSDVLMAGNVNSTDFSIEDTIETVDDLPEGWDDIYNTVPYGGEDKPVAHYLQEKKHEQGTV